MGTVYPALTMDWVTEPDRNGIRRFLIYATLLNYNDTSIVLNSQYITTPIWGAKEIHITKICMIHLGTIGVTLDTVVYTNKPDAASAATPIPIPVNQVVTTGATDYTIAEGDWRLSPSSSSTDTSSVNWLLTTAAGYAATDDIYYVIEGWIR